MVVSPLWFGPVASPWMQNPTGKDRLLLKRGFRCEDNNVDLLRVKPHYYCVRQVELSHHLLDEAAW